MKEVIEDIIRWRSDAKTIGLATVIETWGSAPRKTAAKMAITTDGKISGSVSGGCVEGAVFDEAVATIDASQGKLVQYGVADETAWEVGLACGGSISVFVEPLDEAIFGAIQTLFDEDRIGAAGTIVHAPDPAKVGQKTVIDANGLMAGYEDAAIQKEIETVMKSGKHGRVELADGSELFVEVFLPAPQLIMVGGVHIAVSLVHIAKVLGYRTVVVDPRRAFGSEERFDHADQLIPQWPEKAFSRLTINENTAIALLTHDPKIDDPALHQVLDSPAFYIGALGSRKTHAKRVARLKEAGYTDEQIDRIYGPIGLGIGAQNPEEISVAVMGQIISARRQ